MVGKLLVMPTITFVAEDEILYRRVPSGKRLYQIFPDGSITIEPSAFEDRECRVSVDRAILRKYNPLDTLNQEKDGSDGGVVSLVTSEVRASKGIVRNDTQGNFILEFEIQVSHVPIPNNYSHAEIHGDPNFTDRDKKRAFRKLRHRLAELVEARQWEVRPRTL